MTKKKRLLAVILWSASLTSLEMGVFIEGVWHGWGGFGDISMEYTAAGGIGFSFLLSFIPMSVTALFLIRMISRIKKRGNIQGLLFDSVCALFGIGMRLGSALIFPFTVRIDPIVRLGRQVTAFLIDKLNWMGYPIP